MLHQVLRKFRAEGVDRKAGEIIETSTWKNERLLIEHRFLGKPSVPQEDAATVVAGAQVEPQPSTGANSKPESPKVTPAPKPTPIKTQAKKPAAVKVASSKPAVLNRGTGVAGNARVVKAAK